MKFQHVSPAQLPLLQGQGDYRVSNSYVMLASMSSVADVSPDLTGGNPDVVT
jgi:hypothetical protein